MSTIYRTVRTTSVDKLQAAPATPKRSPGRPAKAKTPKTPKRTEAKFEIVGENDREGIIQDAHGRVLIDGIVPLELALQFKALCDLHNARPANTD